MPLSMTLSQAPMCSNLTSYRREIHELAPPRHRPRRCPMFLMAVIIALILPNTVPTLAQGEQGVVTVRVVYRGSVPPPTIMKVTRDPEICGTTMPVQSLTVHSPSGGLKDAVVMIEGLHLPNTEHTPAPAPSMVLSNSRCSFSPHVMIL